MARGAQLGPLMGGLQGQEGGPGEEHIRIHMVGSHYCRAESNTTL